MTEIASTSSSGQPTRQYPQTFVADILGRVHVPVAIENYTKYLKGKI